MISNMKYYYKKMFQFESIWLEEGLSKLWIDVMLLCTCETSFSFLIFLYPESFKKNTSHTLICAPEDGRWCGLPHTSYSHTKNIFSSAHANTCTQTVFAPRVLLNLDSSYFGVDMRLDASFWAASRWHNLTQMPTKLC